MVLRALGHRNVSFDELVADMGTQSTWTIDVARVLASRGARVAFCTVSPGVLDAYEHEPFYSEQISEDRKRVQSLVRQSHSIVAK